MITRTTTVAAGLLGIAILSTAHGLIAGELSDVVQNDSAKKWAFSLSASSYLIPNDRDYVQPTLSADRGRIHLEARYNYEGLEAGSAWVGWNFSAGQELTMELTPMIGVVFGDTRGAAPGVELSLEWKKLSFYSEGEFVIDTAGRSESYLYTWSQLTYAPCDWFQFGLVAQRTRLYDSGLDIDRGPMVQFTWKHINFTTCLFDLGWKQPTVVLGVTVNF